MIALLTGLALAREVVVLGERLAPADHGGWPAVLSTCLEAARPGAYVVVDGTAPGASPADTRRRLAQGGWEPGARVLLSVGAPGGAPGWASGLRALLRDAAATGGAALFGPFPAAERLVQGTGHIPDSAAGIVRESRAWRRAAHLAAQAGVLHLAWDPRPLPPDLPPAPAVGPPNADAAGAWRPVPEPSPGALGRLACAHVLAGP